MGFYVAYPLKTRFRNIIISLGGDEFRKIGPLKLLFIMVQGIAGPISARPRRRMPEAVSPSLRDRRVLSPWKPSG